MLSAEQNVKNRKIGTKETDNTSHENGMLKGKGPDPRNWGNVRLTREEKDPELQRVLLDLYKSAQKNKQKRNNKCSNKRKRSALEQNSSVKDLYSTSEKVMKHDKGQAM